MYGVVGLLPTCSRGLGPSLRAFAHKFTLNAARGAHALSTVTLPEQSEVSARRLPCSDVIVQPPVPPSLLPTPQKG